MTSAPADLGVFNLRIAALDADGAPQLLRSSAPDAITLEGLAVLRRVGVRRIVDLREPGEATADTERGGIEITPVPLYRFATGVPFLGAIDELYPLVLTERAEALAEAVTAIADADGPVLVHCSLGKDRTGMTVAALRLAAGHPRAEVLADYAASAEQLPAERRALIETELERLGVDPTVRSKTLELHLESPQETLARALDGALASGSAADLLRRGGIREDVLIRIRERFARSPVTPGLDHFGTGARTSPADLPR